MGNINEISYRDLQKRCKKEGLKASGKREELIERLVDHLEEKEDKPKVQQDVPDNVKVVVIVDSRDRVKRTFTPDIHGDNFLEVAETYLETHKGKGLTAKFE